ncbi:MAG: hypothetical protein UV41_C0034G0007 [Candidatus Daviesbacteria bacterium GW2011_GWA2_42_7]|uniref:Uncharacterized protein n=1 Tax=Candidatus Daviesbacteria bacterium GW2011_GWA2_42_7 TaxID=1618425 RepID=A0A0G1B9X7_9BACT|nr:MAG: hypothetical protein UV41_C0034G0007 [Candidatus Daviesbacteria bacterium GW2011_GWA2_42_7]OGE18926.1 MAG: hypothetical protein A2874_03760 [Candidatus Daviesbacteria bacterium RIFCSPHIGHO2_01_FULL_43_17]
MLALGYFGLAAAAFKFASGIRWKVFFVLYYLLLYFIFLVLIEPPKEDYNGNMVFMGINIVVLILHLIFTVFLYQNVQKRTSLENARKILGKEIYLMSDEQLHSHIKHRL